MPVESYVQMLRNMKKRMRTVVIEGIRIQWLLESFRGEDVWGAEMESGVRKGGVCTWPVWIKVVGFVGARYE